MSEFLTITPRADDWTKYKYFFIQKFRLRVIRGDVNIKPNINIVVNDLNDGYKHFHNNGSRGSSFTVEILVKDTDKVQATSLPEENADLFVDIDDKPLSTILDYVIRNMIPVILVSESPYIKNDLYIITENGSRKQTHRGSSVWSLTFTLMDEFKYNSFANTNKGVQSALKKYQKKQANAKKKAQQKKEQQVKTTAKYKLQHNCKASQLKYTTNQKAVTCVKYLQRILNNKTGSNLKLDGWYGKETKQAVKNFQKKYKKKYKLKETGNVDSATFKALYTV